MEADPTNLTYTACAILIAVYAWGRFNTPSARRAEASQIAALPVESPSVAPAPIAVNEPVTP